MKNFAWIALMSLGLLAVATRPALANDVNPYSYQNDPRWEHVSKDSICEPDTFTKMFPFSLNDDLAAPVDDIVTSTFFFNILPFGGLWGPLVTLPDGHPSMNQGDVVVSYLVPYLVGHALIWTLSYFGVGLIGCVPLCYNAPVAALNGWDRAYKCSGHSSKKHAPKAAPKSDDGNDGGDDGYAY